MKHEIVMEQLDEMAKAFAAKINAEVEDRGEHFAIYRRALERGVDRLDIYGDMIVNHEMPERDAEVKEQLAMLYSGIIQAGVAAICILQGLPDIPISGFEMMSHDEQH